MMFNTHCLIVSTFTPCLDYTAGENCRQAELIQKLQDKDQCKSVEESNILLHSLTITN